MDQFVGTPNCPHLGFDLQGGRPCCHADDQTRTQCGKFAPNPAFRSAPELGVEPFFCTVLGKETIPAEALRLGAQEKAAAARQAASSNTPRFKPPAGAHGHLEARPDRTQQPAEGDPIIPTHTLKAEGKQIMPNDRCPCGSGKKYKKCCGR